MIVFGHYSFAIDSYDSSNIKLGNLLQRGDVLELTVRVVHLFWIPVFPFEKLWIINRNGQKLKVNDELSSLLNATLGRKRVPFYSFALLLLIPFVYLVMSTSIKYEENKRAKARIEHDRLWIEKKAEQIMDPMKGDYYVITEGGCEDSYHNSIFKVIDYSQDSTVLKIPDTDEKLYWGGNRYKWNQYFDDPQNKFRMVTVTKTSLDSACTKNMENLSYFPGAPIPGITQGKCAKIDRVERMGN